MSKQQQGSQQDNQLENVENALSKTEQFIEENQSKLSIIALVIIVLVAGYWGIKKFYIQPLETNAQEQIFYAQQYFEKDSFNLALNGDGINPGFIEIMENYSSTKAGNLAKYYVGVSNLQLGNFEQAVEYLQSFSTNESVIAATAAGALGDAYSELEQIDKAIAQYQDAVDYDNALTSPSYLMKLGVMFELKGDYTSALEAYNEIKNAYNTSNEARQIQKYITRAELALKK